MNFIVGSNLFRNEGKHCSRVTKRNAHTPKLGVILAYNESNKNMHLKSFSRMFIYTKTYQLQQQLQKITVSNNTSLHLFELHDMSCMSSKGIIHC